MPGQITMTELFEHQHRKIVEECGVPKEMIMGHGPDEQDEKPYVVDENGQLNMFLTAELQGNGNTTKSDVVEHEQLRFYSVSAVKNPPTEEQAIE